MPADSSPASLDTPYFLPVPPPLIERRHDEFRQALRLPKTLWNILTIVRQDFSIRELDGCLWSFLGFHQHPADRLYQVRPWRKVQLRSIEAGDIAGLAVWEMALMLQIAMEDEEPILEYSHQSGEGFRFLLPNLGRFMGRNQEQATSAAAAPGRKVCEGPWCAEERRHSNTLARIIHRITGKPPRRDNPNQPMVVTADEQAALHHLISRQASEWNASSSYIVMAAHATGHLHQLLRNLERDEVKHLAIMSAASVYLLGPRPWGRFLDLVKKGLENYGGQRKTRSGGNALGANAITAIEGVVAHLLVELYTVRWLKTLPLRTLATIFDSPSCVPDLDAAPLPPQQEEEAAQLVHLGREKRRKLERWEPEIRHRALEQQDFEESQSESIQQIIDGPLGGFRGAEVPGSPGDANLRHRIRRIAGPGRGVLKTCLLHLLRDFQIHYHASESAESGGDAIDHR